MVMTPTDQTIDDEPLPPTLAAKFETAFGLDNPPETFGDWAEALGDAAADVGMEPNLEALCVTDDSGHVAEVDGERRHFHCVLDTFLLPAILDADRVDATSRSPIDGRTVEFTLTGEAVTAQPPEAVISFGTAADVEPPGDGEFDPGQAYDQVCPYINAFPSREAYERWSATTDGAVTIGLPIDRGVELADLLVGTEPFVTDG